jgi:hypothetical protein
MLRQKSSLYGSAEHSVPNNIISLNSIQEVDMPAADEERKTQGQMLLEIIKEEKIEYFKASNDGGTYVRFPIETNGKNHFENWKIRSERFKSWLKLRFYKKYDKTVGTQAFTDVVSLIDAKAEFSGMKQEVFVRVGKFDEKIYVDLCNENWEVIEIDKSGWQLLDSTSCPIRFKRSNGMEALPYPVAYGTGDINLLKKFVSIGDSKNDWILLISYVLGCYTYGGAYPILVLQGTHGSAKSTHTKLVRTLIDPNAIAIKTIATNEMDMAISAQTNWVQAYDNLSGLSPALSDSLCRLSTGGGISTRKLYSDDEEVILDFKRPVILNGIDDIATRQDLADRSIIITLPSIQEKDRKLEGELWEEFNEASPRIIAGIFDVLSETLKRKGGVKLKEMPRLADFYLFATAAEIPLGFNDGDFLNAFNSSKEEMIDDSIERDGFLSGFIRMVEKEGGEIRTNATTMAMEMLPKYIPDDMRRGVNPYTLKSRLTRILPLLNKKGIFIKFERTNSGRIIHITYQ